jgi:hypothetical protein
MPQPYVKTIREEILYEYAKLIFRSAYGSRGLDMIIFRKKYGLSLLSSNLL